MTDKELLQLAAKAAGIEIVGWLNDDDATALRIEDGVRVYWEPLYDDGDAFRLAIRLKLQILDTGQLVSSFKGEGIGLATEWKREDEFAAYRRAIVRAAAEIGRGME